MKRHLALFVLGMASVLYAAASPPLDIRFEQRIGQPLPMGELFTDEYGQTRPLNSYFNGKPAVLIFSYLRCPEICSLVAGGAVDTLRQLKPTVGRDYVVISVSIDPTDTPEMARSRQRKDALHYGRTGASAGWHMLVGKSSAIRALAKAAGFHYTYDARSQLYAHPSGMVLVTPKGIVSSYFLGVDFPAREVAPALRRAAENKTGSSVFSLLFICFQGGSPEGRYGGVIWAVLSASVAFTVTAVFGGIFWMLRKERGLHSREGGTA